MLNTLDVGCGPNAAKTIPIGVEMHFCDIREFDNPLTEVQDMEKMTYPSWCFDIVYCTNALDHTPDALAAVKEMMRVCRPGGWVYIDCALIQRTTSGGHHAWDADEDGWLTSKNSQFNLKDLGFTITLEDNHAERRYNHMIAVKQC